MKNGKVAASVERIRRVIDEEVDPRRMSREEYHELLEELSFDIDARLTALEEEEKRAK